MCLHDLWEHGFDLKLIKNIIIKKTFGYISFPFNVYYLLKQQKLVLFIIFDSLILC